MVLSDDPRPAPSAPDAGFRVVRLLATPAPRFAQLATPAAPYLAATSLPPARCWRHLDHQAPEADCSCGYHGFWSRTHAIEFAELFTPLGHRFPPHRFVARCVPVGAQPVGADDPGAGFRATSVRYLALTLPPSCTCGRRAVGVRALPPVQCSDRLDAASVHPVCAAACARHADAALLAAVTALVDIE